MHGLFKAGTGLSTVHDRRQCIRWHFGGGEELPAQKTGGLYKINGICALRFCKGLSVHGERSR